MASDACNPGPNHERIWLSPRCDDSKTFGDGRLWCQDRQDPCGECGADWVEYTRADLRIAADRVALAHAGELAVELRTHAQCARDSRYESAIPYEPDDALFDKSAATLTTQAARIASLEAALNEISNSSEATSIVGMRARAALKGD